MCVRVCTTVRSNKHILKNTKNPNFQSIRAISVSAHVYNEESTADERWTIAKYVLPIL